MWRRGISIPLTLDAAAPGFIVGVAVGRIGDLLIADHLGTTTDFFLGYRIPAGAELAPGYNNLPMYAPGQVVHQTALYDLLGVCVLAGFLALVARREPATGTLFWTFSIWYGLQRILVDFTRNRELIESSFFGFSGSQWAGAAFALGGAVGLVWSHRRTAEPVSAEGTEPAPEEPEAVEAQSEPPEPVEAQPEALEAEPEAAEAGPEPPEPVEAEPEPVSVATAVVTLGADDEASEEPPEMPDRPAEETTPEEPGPAEGAEVEQAPLFEPDQSEEPPDGERPASDA
jgi:hypothetical protein